MRSTYRNIMNCFDNTVSQALISVGSAATCITVGFAEDSVIQNARGRPDKDDISFNAAWASGGVNIGADILGLVPLVETIVAFSSKVRSSHWNYKQLIAVGLYTAMELSMCFYSIPLLSTKNTIARSVVAGINPALSFLVRNTVARTGVFDAIGEEQPVLREGPEQRYI